MKNDGLGSDDLSVQSRILAHKVGCFGMFKQVELSDLLAYNTTDGNYEATRERMSDAWHEYQNAMPQLRCPFRSALTFLASPTWKDSRLWSWNEQPEAFGKTDKQRKWEQEERVEMTLEQVNEVRQKIGQPPLVSL